MSMQIRKDAENLYRDQSWTNTPVPVEVRGVEGNKTIDRFEFNRHLKQRFR